MVLRGSDQRILAMLGVRFVISDTQDSLRVSEIVGPNVGDYSPTIVTKSITATDIIARLRDPFFDPKVQIIANVPDDATGLVPAQCAPGFCWCIAENSSPERRAVDPVNSSGIQPLSRNHDSGLKAAPIPGKLARNRRPVFWPIGRPADDSERTFPESRLPPSGLF